MKVIIASCVVPFVEGGATFLVEWLGQAIKSRGHAVETLLFPFSANYTEMLDQMMALRLLDLSQHGDRLIAVRTPSYLLQHPHKILWFIHHHRPAYDLWGTRYQDIPNTPEGICYRDAIHQADNIAFSEARKIFSNSRVVAERLKQFNKVDAEVLLPPLGDPERFHCRSMGDYVLYVSRFTHHKRQWLAIEGMRHTKTPVHLVLAGKADPDSAAYVNDLRSQVEKYGLQSRVSIIDRFVSEQEKIDLFADSLAGIYFPLDEDSYGYPTLEAHHSGKPVITTSDSGGTAELILDGVNGFLTAPDPEAIGQAMDRLYLDRAMASAMGNSGRERIAQLNITWDNVLEKLLG